jgi:hypothetical protein
MAAISGVGVFFANMGSPSGWRMSNFSRFLDDVIKKLAQG